LSAIPAGNMDLEGTREPGNEIRIDKVPAQEPDPDEMLGEIEKYMEGKANFSGLAIICCITSVFE